MDQVEGSSDEGRGSAESSRTSQTQPVSSPTLGSICAMKRNVHAIIPEADFECTRGKDVLQQYTFNTGVAKHLFCKRCGVTPFYRPRSNPFHYAVTIACIDPGSIQTLVVRKVDGQNWEKAVPACGIQDL
ncbi:hypothetical protein ACKKBG_A30315 [Auxenochlorella protothecoides x Auxenochlorella symbiontica]